MTTSANNVDMDRPTLVIPVGLPACGKSHYARELENVAVVSTDAIRIEVAGSLEEAHKLKRNGLVFGIFHNRIYENLSAGLDVVADATNLLSKARAELRSIADLCNAQTNLILFTDAATAITRNAERKGDERVPDEAMGRMLIQWQEALRDIPSETYTALASALTPGQFDKLDREPRCIK